VRRAHYSSRGVLSNAVCLSVISKPERCGSLDSPGMSSNKNFVKICEEEGDNARINVTLRRFHENVFAVEKQ